MMIKKINNLFRQLSEAEQKELLDHIERQYAISFKGEGMLRDDIKDKVFELLHRDFEWLDENEPSETSSLPHLDIDSLDATELSLSIEEDFDIDFINPDDIQRWKTVKDIINYIEDALENKSEPYINGFELES